jgi:hypothetical protein
LLRFVQAGREERRFPGPAKSDNRDEPRLFIERAAEAVLFLLEVVQVLPAYLWGFVEEHFANTRIRN